MRQKNEEQDQELEVRGSHQECLTTRHSRNAQNLRHQRSPDPDAKTERYTQVVQEIEEVNVIRFDSLLTRFAEHHVLRKR